MSRTSDHLSADRDVAPPSVRRDDAFATMTIYRDIWRVLEPPQRLRLVMAQCVSVAIGISTLGGVTAIVPFFSVLSDPNAIAPGTILGNLYRALGYTDKREFVVLLGVAFVLAVCVSNALNALGFFLITRFSYRLGSDFHVALFDEYLHRDLRFHSSIHGATLLNTVIHDAHRVTISIIQGLLVIGTCAVASTLIVVSVLIVNAPVALAAIIVIAGSYAVIYSVVRRRISNYGCAENALTAERVRIVNESLAGIREILLAGTQDLVRQRFAAACAAIARYSANTISVAQSPRQLIECVTCAGLVVAALVLSARDSGARPWLGQLTFMGFAAYRLLPALQQMFAASVWIRADRPAFERVVQDLAISHRRRLLPPCEPEIRYQGAPRDAIVLSAVSFRHAPGVRPALEDVSLRIPAGALVALVGRNGSGKTTLADLVLGLLAPDHGRVEIDGVLLTPSNAASWQAMTAYVPQEIFLADASIAENIALGVTREAIDWNRLREAARTARVDEFADLRPGGTEPTVGERGRRLSGGQRQRIGIARALYRNARLLVLDEATSALDAVAEREVIGALEALRGVKTTIMITHRLSSVRQCDIIFEMESGRLVGRGTFDHLTRTSERFRRGTRRGAEPTLLQP